MTARSSEVSSGYNLTLLINDAITVCITMQRLNDFHHKGQASIIVTDTDVNCGACFPPLFLSVLITGYPHYREVEYSLMTIIATLTVSVNQRQRRYSKSCNSQFALFKSNCQTCNVYSTCSWSNCWLVSFIVDINYKNVYVLMDSLQVICRSDGVVNISIGVYTYRFNYLYRAQSRAQVMGKSNNRHDRIIYDFQVLQLVNVVSGRQQHEGSCGFQIKIVLGEFLCKLVPSAVYLFTGFRTSAKLI